MSSSSATVGHGERPARNAGQAIESLLFGLRAGDLPRIAAVSALLGGVALVACLVPAHRAGSTQLSSMLRAE